MGVVIKMMDGREYRLNDIQDIATYCVKEDGSPIRKQDVASITEDDVLFRRVKETTFLKTPVVDDNGYVLREEPKTTTKKKVEPCLFFFTE